MTKAQKHKSAVKRPDRTLLITRTFDASPEALWKAWTDPESLKRWWGPRYFIAPFSRIDLRTGGTYLHCMRSPEGKDYWSTGAYREIDPLKRLVFTDSFADEQGTVVPASYYGMAGKWPKELLVTVSFMRRKQGVTMTLRHKGFPTVKMRELTGQGWSESFDKLAESLKLSAAFAIVAEPGRQELIVTREFDAPRERVFAAYTDPKLIPDWWGPKEYETAVESMDVRPGGAWRFIQRDRSGTEYKFHGLYHEVSSPARIVATFECEGTPGRVSLDTTEFEERGGTTRLTSRTVFQSVADRDEMLKEGMAAGITETMDRLAELLARGYRWKEAA